ncbi:acyl carrier protein [Arcobacter porcinus]|uniref:acyl carrier protein n=1 Tax=Arcobacter porcinus TaxID=1935204 RepID=UPI000825829A|nr:phosphopantetheine-binding protein [Arcobacter porcinus]OCL85618.1 Acyl carrier protein [Arcobacter porcinus]
MIKDEIVKVISDILNISSSSLSDESNYCNTNGWDSMATTNIIIALEEKFDIDIELDDAEKFTSIKNILEILQSKYI